jgi:hypothetical protein
MKITLIVLFILCAAAAFGQNAAVIPAQPQPLVFTDHPLHAEPHAMAMERPIAGTSADYYSYAQGEQPLWQFGPVTEPVPLGDVARKYRQEKLTAKKSAIVLEKQGS